MIKLVLYVHFIFIDETILSFKQFLTGFIVWFKELLNSRILDAVW